MSKAFGVSELKEVILELDRESNQCKTCWPTTVFSQGSFTPRKVYCCSKFVKADGGGKMTSQEEGEESCIFSGVHFLLAGFEAAYENQFIEELEANGGVNAGTYSSTCTHVIVSNLSYDDPICAAARKDGKALVTEAWVADCLDNDSLADVDQVLYRPLKDLDGIPGSEDLCVCLTGYQGQARQKIMRMVELIGARFTKPLLGNIVTHLVCYKFEGEKYELAKKAGLKLINHFWLEDCLKSWSLLPEEDYSLSGWEVENGAKQPRVTKGTAEVDRTPPVSQEKVKIRKSGASQSPSAGQGDVRTHRRNSGKFDNENSKVRSPPGKVSNSSAPSPSGQQEGKGKKGQQGTAEVEVANQRVSSPQTAPSVKTFKRGNSFQGADVFQEVFKNLEIVHQGDESNSARFKSSRRSSCGGDQASPSTPGFRVATDMEPVDALAVSRSKKRLSGAEEVVDRMAHNTGEKTVEYESPDSKRRRSSSSSKSGPAPSPSAVKDPQSRGQNLPSNSPVGRHVISYSDAPESGRLRNHNLSREEMNMQQEVSLDSSGTKDMEVCEPSGYLASPQNRRLAKDSGMQAKVVDVHLDKREQSNSPLSHPVAQEDASIGVVLRTPHRMGTLNVAVEKDSEFALKARRSVNKRSSLSPFKDRCEETSVPDGTGSSKDASPKATLRKGSVSIHSTFESTRKSFDNGADQVLEQYSSRGTTVLGISAEPVCVKESIRKSGKVVSSRPRHKPSEKADTPYPEHQDEESPDDRKKKTGQSSREQVTGAGADASFAEWQEHAQIATCSGEQVDEMKTTADGSRQKGSQLKSTNRETSTSAKVQGSLSKLEKGVKKKQPNSDGDNSSREQDKENVELQRSRDIDLSKGGATKKKSGKKGARVSLLGTTASEAQRCFAVGGTTAQRNNLHYLIKLLGAKVCKSRYEWKDDITHVVLPAPLRRTEKFLAAAAAGRWILKPEYLQASRDAGRFLEEEEYEWCGDGVNNKGTDTLKRAIRAGGGFVLTTPPFSQHLVDGVDFAIIRGDLVSKDDKHVQEFLQHKVACVSFDYFVDYICHPSASLEKHVLYNTHAAVAGAVKRLRKSIMQGPTEEIEKLRRLNIQRLSTSQPKRSKEDDIACVVCGRTDDEDVMLLCGDDKGNGCGLGTHIHCCSPPLPEVPEEDWFCRNCEDL
ncbi:hypothetical protein R1sor_004701 [Riccia sorocarpa]|uniref:BRCT domain-containing protein n=1 Tax=Riccia sorocarpa TaxID=122646 RepID=A0ABD3HHF2_9MARC